jgi:hypothetical protein
MKYLLLLLAIASTRIGLAQSEQKAIDSLYIITYTTGPAWDISKSPADQPYFREHGARLGQLRKDGIIKFGARHGDKGSVVIAAKNFQAAKEIVLADVAVANKLFSVVVEKLNIFYGGCLEK